MNMAGSVDHLDAIEEFVIEEMAAHGWRLERKPFSGWPVPDGWQYCGLGIANRGGKPFRLEILTRWRETGSEPKQGEETAQDCKRLEAVMHNLWVVREALDRDDAVATMAATTGLDISLQFFAKRHSDRDLLTYSKLPRLGGRKLPDDAKFQAELDEIVVKHGKSGAAAIMAKKYGVGAAAVRKALRKKKSET